MAKVKFPLTKEALYQKYVVEKLSTVEIANFFGCSTQNVSYWMEKLQIKRRTKGEAQMGEKNPMYGKRWSEEKKREMSQKRMGHPVTNETCRKQSVALKGRYMGVESSRWGKPTSDATKEKLSKLRKGKKRPIMAGDRHPNWKGGITPKNQVNRSSIEAKLWREAVFARDSFTCVWCGDKRGGNLQADHIQTWAEYPELRFAIDNGRTLCKTCHKKRHQAYGEN